MLTNPTAGRRFAGRLTVIAAVAIALPLTATRAIEYVDKVVPAEPAPVAQAAPAAAVAPVAAVAPLAPVAPAAPLVQAPPAPAVAHSDDDFRWNKDLHFDRDEKIFTLTLLGNNRTIGNWIRRKPSHLYITFIFYHSIHDEALDVMRVHCIRRHANSITNSFASFTIMLCHYIFADHPPRFTDICLMRPVPIVNVFIFWISPFQHLIS